MYSSPIEEIKNRLDVMEVVREYIQLQKAGANYRAICPFHSEKGPSFFVSPARQSWHCFGCGVGGDIFAFVMQIEGIEFGDALRLLAQKAGVELPRRDPAFAKMETERKRLQELLELAVRFFEKQLASSTPGKEAKRYLLSRGITEESIARWRLGYAPDSMNALFMFLSKQGYREYEIGRAGLLAKSEGKTIDRFRGRIMFPILDFNGQPAGFGGRIFGKKEGQDLAKYINISNTPVYDKSKILYGLDKAKLAIRKNDFCILVEGYVDAIMVFQAGWENVVATSGTALTSSHLQILKRYSGTVYMAFDRDSAGEAAAKKGIDQAIAAGFRTKVIVMPPGEDPADVVKANPDRWKELVEGAKSVFDFYFETMFARFDKATSEGRGDILEGMLPVIRRLPNKVEQDHWIRRLADELEVREESIRTELVALPEEQSVSIDEKHHAAVNASHEGKTRKQLLEEQALMLLFSSPRNLSSLPEEMLPLFSLPVQEIFAGMKKNPQFEFRVFEEIFPEDTVEFLRIISLRAEVEEAGDDVEQEFQDCLRELRKMHDREKLEFLRLEMKKAESGGDQSKVKTLLEEFHKISHSLHNG